VKRCAQGPAVVTVGDPTAPEGPNSPAGAAPSTRSGPAGGTLVGMTAAVFAQGRKLRFFIRGTNVT
jgi:hypothetical protein